MQWRRYLHVYSIAPNKTSVSARHFHNRYDSTFSFDIEIRRSRKFVPVDKAVCTNVVARNIVDVDVVVTVDAPVDGNCSRKCGIGALVRVHRVCTDGPCRVHSRLGTILLLLLLLLLLLRLLRRRRDRCLFLLLYTSSFPSSLSFPSGLGVFLFFFFFFFFFSFFFFFFF